jgi:endoglucanase
MLSDNLQTSMKNIVKSLIVLALVNLMSCKSEEYQWIRINQIGYRNNDIKVAVLLSKRKTDLKTFKIVNAKSGDVVMTFDNPVSTITLKPFISCYRLPFSNLKKNGVYKIIAGKTVSAEFRIGDDVYDGTADFLLKYASAKKWF